ncbi:2334_t:CDS:2, partial [Racocetra fulgida]
DIMGITVQEPVALLNNKKKKISDNTKILITAIEIIAYTQYLPLEMSALFVISKREIEENVKSLLEHLTKKEYKKNKGSENKSKKKQTEEEDEEIAINHEKTSDLN